MVNVCVFNENESLRISKAFSNWRDVWDMDKKACRHKKEKCSTSGHCGYLAVLKDF